MHVVAAQWCLGHRLCGPDGCGDVRRFIPASGTVTADQFADWVLLSSDPDAQGSEPVWQRARAEIREAFVTHMGGEEVDASRLQWPHEYLPLPDPEAFTRNLTQEELLGYRETYGERSREWILAQNELRRRNGPSTRSVLIFWAAMLALFGLLCWFHPWS